MALAVVALAFSGAAHAAADPPHWSIDSAVLPRAAAVGFPVAADTDGGNSGGWDPLDPSPTDSSDTFGNLPLNQSTSSSSNVGVIAGISFAVVSLIGFVVAYLVGQANAERRGTSSNRGSGVLWTDNGSSGDGSHHHHHHGGGHDSGGHSGGGDAGVGHHGF
ncbi:hypothetical protein [Catenulispora pinisilvae]|uniref:hypothetical protein n=1 Tax=Catenulispora pinisilvae TaxID=2705253 RepID=UPI001891C486|nr:hypothetical protein [Catenulispora pinisilvae]